MKWYFWVLVGVAVLLTIIAIVAAVNSGKRKAQSTEAEVIKSNPDTLATSKSMIYQSLSRISDSKVVTKPAAMVTYESKTEVPCTTCK